MCRTGEKSFVCGGIKYMGGGLDARAVYYFYQQGIWQRRS